MCGWLKWLLWKALTSTFQAWWLCQELVSANIPRQHSPDLPFPLCLPTPLRRVLHTVQAQSSTYYTDCERCSQVVTHALAPLISLGGSGPFLISVLPHSNEAEPTAFCYNCISCCSCFYLSRLLSIQACRAPRKLGCCKETTGTVSSWGHWEPSPWYNLVEGQERSSQWHLNAQAQTYTKLAIKVRYLEGMTQNPF